MPQLRNTYIKSGQLRIVFRDFPVPTIHPSAVRAAHAAHCASEQGRYWEMHDRLFNDADHFSPSHDSDFALFRTAAQDLGLDVETFMVCMESHKYLDPITGEIEAARKAGITATPAYLLNGELLLGLYPITTWERLIDAELGKVKH
ncbi:MAG: hypothetical protein NVS2B7_35930 [Herpetosiphon sp.]